MSVAAIEDHPLRYQLTNELHARPFPALRAPCRAAYLAVMRVEGAAERDGAADRAHLDAFIDRHGGPRPAADASHFFADFGRFRLKWERHTEFVSYTIFEDGTGAAPFDGSCLRHLPADWLASAPGAVIAAALLHIEPVEGAAGAAARLAELGPQFNGESLAAALVVDGAAVVAGDFRIHEDGFSRFAVLTPGEVGAKRLGRVAQRLLEVETYRALAMLALPVARRVSARLTEIERDLSALMASYAVEAPDSPPVVKLEELTRLSAEIEALSAESGFRFGAAGAYAAIVDQRVEVLREARFEGRQLFSEFMVRRFDPAMRTCRSAERRLAELSGRASRAANLLRTRINVAVEQQNQRLLESMDRRAAMQFRLQETVEGLSVVAISYYAVSLASYVLDPAAAALGLGKSALTALITLPVIAVVWLLVRRVRRRLGSADKAGRQQPGQQQ